MSPRWAVAGVVEAPADQVFARVCAIGPAGDGQLAGSPDPGATTGTDGVRRSTAIGRPPQTTVTVEVDPPDARSPSRATGGTAACTPSRPTRAAASSTTRSTT